MIEIYKITNGMERLNVDRLFIPSKISKTRRHAMKLQCSTFKAIRENIFFIQRIIKPEFGTRGVVNAVSVAEFKRGFDEFLKEKSISRYKTGPWKSTAYPVDKQHGVCTVCEPGRYL